MTSEARDLLDAALALPTGERAGVAAALLASLDDGTDAEAEAVEAAWVAELQGRAGRVTTGESPGVPWEDVRADLAGRLARG
jgi:putative addiction module component (TIGR02574 family)